jgi:hypothetical protein
MFRGGRGLLENDMATKDVRDMSIEELRDKLVAGGNVVEIGAARAEFDFRQVRSNDRNATYMLISVFIAAASAIALAVSAYYAYWTAVHGH